MSRDPLVRAANVWSRRLHRWGAVLVAAPILAVICTGLLLQLKKQAAWVQPPTVQGSGTRATIALERVLEVVRGVPEAAVREWEDIDRLDLRLRDGTIKVQCLNRWEVQVDAATGAVLQVRYRRSDLIESLHDGSFFHPVVKLGVFLPAGVVLLGLWVTGIYLWFLPLVARRSAARRRAEFRAAREDGGLDDGSDRA